VSIPGWTRYDIGVRYRALAGGKPVVLRANIENLFNKNAWLLGGTFLTVSAGGTVVLSASIDF
jgi:iron complex outermembrane receptor protein